MQKVTFVPRVLVLAPSLHQFVYMNLLLTITSWIKLLFVSYQALLAMPSCVPSSFSFKFLLTRMEYRPSSTQMDLSVQRRHILHSITNNKMTLDDNTAVHFLYKITRWIEFVFFVFSCSPPCITVRFNCHTLCPWRWIYWCLRFFKLLRL